MVVPKIHFGLLGGIYLPSRVNGTIDVENGVADAYVFPKLEIVNTNSVSVSSFAPSSMVINCTLADHSGIVLGHSTRSTNVLPEPGSNFTLGMPNISLVAASLWSPRSPVLYSVVCSLDLGGGIVDLPPAIHIGIREPEWDHESGFKLNGVPTKILGACNHQDFAGVGVAIPDVLQKFRVAKLQEMGVNAWRTAHNAPTPAVLDAADRLGMFHFSFIISIFCFWFV